jgi:AcrR family transcriptional regulator
MSEHHGNRYGRSEAARLAVLHAADDLLVEHGYAACTIEAIAAAAGVAKQTVYRWWPSKTDILFDAFLEDAAQELPPAPDTGDAERDLRRHLARLAAFVSKTHAGAVFRALAGVAQHDPEVAARLRRDFLKPQRERDRAPVLRAAEAGLLPAGVDVDVVLDQLVAPVYHRLLVTGERITRGYTDRLVSAVLSPR